LVTDVITPNSTTVVPDVATLAYLAGFFDGEGCIQITRIKDKRHLIGGAYHQMNLETTQCNPAPLELMKQTFGGWVALKHTTASNRKPLYRHMTSQRKAENMLKLLLPYLIVKKEEAIVALEFMSLCEGVSGLRVSEEMLVKRDSYINRLVQLKRREF
jgi:hypothetical protein